jgi:N6-L-threonylcarbamoyladenine synthase
VQKALIKAGKTLNDIDVIAVTSRPGLPGSLLVGVCFAKALAWSVKKPLIGVNHLEGHVFSSFLQNDVPFPHLCLTASGGHTALYLVKGFGDYEVIGKTLDDAAGEAFDKVGKLVGLSYPAGPTIEKLAAKQEFKDFFQYPRGRKETLNFSFSGLKTAVLYDLVDRGVLDLKTKKILDINPTLQEQVASSLLVCINDVFIKKLKLALKAYPDVKAVTFVGGVACNQFITDNIAQFCEKQDMEFFSPTPRYCTDNAAMIAFVGNYMAKQHKFSDLTLDIFE